MQTLIHDDENKEEEHQNIPNQTQQPNTALSENYFRIVGLVLMILGMTVAMVLLDIELLSLFP